MKGAGFPALVREAEAGFEERRGDIGTQNGIMPGKVIGVGVGDECTWFRIPWIEPQVELRQVKATLE
jgi:hypothetical protein